MKEIKYFEHAINKPGLNNTLAFSMQTKKQEVLLFPYASASRSLTRTKVGQSDQKCKGRPAEFYIKPLESNRENAKI